MRLKAIPIVVLVVGLALTLIAFQEAKRVDEERVSNLLELRAAWRVRDFENKILELSLPVESLATFVATREHLDAAEFHKFAFAARGADPIVRLAWSPLVSGDRRGEFEDMVRRADAASDFAISELDASGRLVPAGERGEYLPVRYEEKFDELPSLRGFDRLSEPQRRATLERARDTGYPAFSPLVAQPEDRGVAARIVLFWPVYRGGQTPATIVERRAAILGFVSGSYPTDEIFAFALRNTPPLIETLSLFIGQSPDQALSKPAARFVYDSKEVESGTNSRGGDPPGGQRLSKSFYQLGQNWTLVFDFPPGVLSGLRSRTPWGYLTLGLLLTSALAAYVDSQRRRQSAVEALVAKRTRELHSASDQLAAIIESSPLPTIVNDRDARVTYWNKAAEKTFGYAADEVVGAKHPLVPEGQLASFETMIRRLEAGEIVRGIEGIRHRKDGSPIEIALSGAAYREPNGETRGFVFTLEDITERNRQEAAEREIAERLQAIVDTTVDGIVVIDARGTAMLFNPAAERLFGYRADEVLGRNIKMLMPPSYSGAHDGYIDNYHRTGERKIIGIGRAVVGQRKDGTTFPMHLSVGEATQFGRPIFVGVVHDLTAQREADEVLRRTQMLLSGIVESSDDAIISKTLDGIVTSWNKAAAEVFGYSAEEMIGQHISVLAVPGHEDDMTQILEKIRLGQRVEHYETQRRRKDGHVLDVSLTVSPLYDTQGAIYGASKIARDITEKKFSERALQRSREHLARVQSFAKIGSTEVDLVTHEVTWSDEFYRLIGVDRDSIRPGVDSFADLIHPDDRALVRDVSLKGRRGEEVEPCEFRLIGPDRSIRWFYRQAAFVRDAEGRPTSLIATMFDITDRKVAEAARHASEEQYRLTFDLAPVGIANVALDGRFVFVNQRLCEMFGASREELLESDFQARTHADDMTRSDGPMRRLISGATPVASWEKRYLREDGGVVWCHITSRLRRDDAGRASHFISIYEDITQRKEAELRRKELEDQLQQSQKMEAVGRLTGGVAHDFNNLLTVVLGNLELLRDDIVADPRLTQRVDAAMRAGQRGADLTHRLLAFSRRQVLEPAVVDINKQIDELIPLLVRTHGETIEIKQRFGSKLWKVVVDPGQFESSIMNLAVNARDAMPNGGTLEIATENVAVDEAYAIQRPGLAMGNYVRVSVSDTGIGMTPEVMKNAFEPFFTTKEVGKGTGLGLSMVYGFVKQSGGHVAIYSEVGVGTTVTMLLPSVPDESARAEVQAALRAIKAGSESILVVEDDLDVRNITIAFLRALGYEALEARTVREAFELLRLNPNINTILTDVILPEGEDGADLARRARELRPGINILFMSGYTDDVVMHDGRLDPGVVLLRKPFTLTQLADKVRAVIDGAPPVSRG